MKTRYTIEYVRNGQERPYGDHVTVVRVLFELDARPGVLLPDDLSERAARYLLSKLECGFTEFVGPFDTMQQHFTPRLARLELVAPGTWEFEVRTPFTD